MEERLIGQIILYSMNLMSQINELLAKIGAYDLTVVIHEMYENVINPDLLQLITYDVCK